MPQASEYYSYHLYEETTAYLRGKLPTNLQHVKMGIVCGSGLGGLEHSLEGEKVEFYYKDIPHFAQSTVPGHVGKFVFGFLSGKPTVLMVGRKHFYEGHDMIKTVYPIRIMKLLGAEILFVTNAAGGLDPNFQVGDFMVISDHVSFAGMAGQNPLIGPNIDSLGPRFPAVSDAYDLSLRVLLVKAAHLVGVPTSALKEGVYVFVAGPSFETRAEARFLRDAVGAGCVGMSTVPEVIAGRHCGLKVLGLSLITNRVAVSRGRSAIAQAFDELGLPLPSESRKESESNTNHASLRRSGSVDDEFQVASHDEVLDTSSKRSLQLQQVVRKFAELLP